MYTYGLLLCLLVSCIQNGSASGSSGPGVADQSCPSENFYCPYASGNKCTELRSDRCTGRDICNYPSTNQEKCYETSQGYTVRLGHADLTSFGFRRRRSSDEWLKLEHQFITYRGFTYEYGKSYDAQVLDILDPMYKYRNGMEIKSSPTNLGYSICTWEDANMVAQAWLKKDYDLTENNCQHFAEALSHILLTGPCNNRASGKRQTDDSTLTMEQYIDQQLRNCSLVCCNHGYPLATNGLLILLMAVGIVVLAL